MRALFVSLTLLLAVAAPASAVYDHAGGAAAPGSVQPAGSTTYTVSVAGVNAPADIVIAVDESASMGTTDFGGSTRFGAVSAAVSAFVDQLSGAGFFGGGGRVGLEVYGDQSSTPQLALTNNTSALKGWLASYAPSTSGTCIACALQGATAMLAGSTRPRITYLIGDGDDTSASLAGAITAATSAHIERRSIALVSGGVPDLTTADSNGAVPVASSTQGVASDLEADPSSLAGATGISWTFHLAPGFTAQSASPGGAVVNGGRDVVWTIPSLGGSSASLSFTSVHDPAAGCGATAVLSGTSFSDDQGDAAPSVGLGPVSVACPTATDVAFGARSITTKGSTTLSLTLTAPAQVRLTFSRATPGRKVGRTCAAPKTSNKSKPACTRYLAAGTLTRSLPGGAQRISIGPRLDGGRKLKPGTYHVTVTLLGGAAPVTVKTLTLKVLSSRR